MMVTSRKQYVVSRLVYSEDTLAEDHDKIKRKHKALIGHVKEYLICDVKRAKQAVLSVLPIIGWMRIYRVREWLLGDVVSGISTGMVAIMQGERMNDIFGPRQNCYNYFREKFSIDG
ncbi:hypothetical protein ILYODFUR_019628 [Ilyodon furcidens]|uniref:Uncharacterized protein n=1 Tax=Ilyodon furcidens TaxID=33524 RepID=A0ABV0U823_9TELE